MLTSKSGNPIETPPQDKKPSTFHNPLARIRFYYLNHFFMLTTTVPDVYPNRPSPSPSPFLPYRRGHSYAEPNVSAPCSKSDKKAWWFSFTEEGKERGNVTVFLVEKNHTRRKRKRRRKPRRRRKNKYVAIVLKFNALLRL